MKVALWTFGKEHKSHLEEAIGLYTGRLRHYCDFEMKILSAGKKKGKLPPQDLKAEEAAAVNRLLTPDHILFCLDENGEALSSVGLSRLLEKQQLISHKIPVFLIGGAYGIDASLLNKAQAVFSLSGLTFPHQIVRLIMAEQLYRAFSILHHEPYHHL